MLYDRDGRFTVKTGPVYQTDRDGYRGKVELEIVDRDRSEKSLKRTGEWRQLGQFSPIWVTLEGQSIQIEELLDVPRGADLINYGETVAKPGKNAKFVKRFRYRAPQEGPIPRKALYVQPGSLIIHRDASGEDRNFARVLDRPLFDGAGAPLEGIWLRVMQLSNDLTNAYQRYVKIESVEDSMSPPTDMARFFFMPQLPDAETVIRWMNYGSVNQSFIGEKLKELESAHTQETGPGPGLQGGGKTAGDGPVRDQVEEH